MVLVSDGHKELDLIDALVSPFFVLAAGIDGDLIGMSIFGFDFASPIFAHAHAELSVATIIGMVCVAIAFATNRPDFSAMGFVETWVALVTVGLVVAHPFVPMLDWLLGHTIAALIAVVVQAAGFYVLAYIG